MHQGDRIGRSYACVHIWRLFTFGTGLKITEVAKMFGQLFFLNGSYVCSNFDIKTMLGYILDGLFTHSSGHPVIHSLSVQSQSQPEPALFRPDPALVHIDFSNEIWYIIVNTV
jgi:hypothetical protein